MDRPNEHRKEILLVPIGKVLVEILGEIAVALRKSYKYHVHIGRSEEPETEMYSDERRQFDAEKLLKLAIARKRESLVAVLGIVDTDMFYGEKSFAYGLNRPHQGLGVMALARLREEYYHKTPDIELFQRRAVTEAIYQVGQAVGMPPCNLKKCVLLPSTTLWRLDAKGQAFCENCQARLQAKLHPQSEATLKKAAARENGAGEAVDEGPAAETQLASTLEPAAPDKQPEDESEVIANLVEPEAPPAAEEAALHISGEEPEEPLVADSGDEK